MQKGNKLPHIAILVDTPSEWGRQIVRGILSYASDAGPWHVWINPTASDRFTHLPKGWAGDGVIARISNPELADQLRQSGLPVVNVCDYSLPGHRFPCVRTDDYATTRMAADFFLHHGFKRIAFAGLDHMENPIWYANAFRDYLAAKGITTPVFLKKEGMEDDTMLPALSAWLHSLLKPIGILTWGHTLGQQIIECCVDAGISVPHDVSVLSGCYDELLSHATNPTLSGIVLPTEQIGRRAAALLDDMLKGRKVPSETVYLPPLGIKSQMSTDTIAVDDPMLASVVEFLKQHAYEPITMADIMKVAPTNRRSLERCFRKAFGHTIIDEIRYLRIEKARQLLADSDKPMQIIAEECGYATYNYLAYVFRQTTGMSPNAYRKKTRSRVV